MFGKFYSGKIAWVTGHTGFKGAWLSLWLRDLGANVHGLALAPHATPNLHETLAPKTFVNETIGGVPVLVSYCPLCNSGVVFDRRGGGRTLVFGNTGRIRHFDMVMYDRETESWWQQFLGEAIIGALTGQQMKLVPARLESLARFIERAPQGKLLVPNDPKARPYGGTPYANMERGEPRVFQRYKLPPGLRSMDRVVVIGEDAWPVKLVRAKNSLKAGGMVLTWLPGQNSLHDNRDISKGRDVGNIIVQKTRAGKLVDVPYDVTFAFAFKAYRPDGRLHLK